MPTNLLAPQQPAGSPRNLLSNIPQTPQPIEKKSVGGFLGNVLKSGAGLVKDVGTAVLNPIDTAKGLGTLGVGLVEKAIPGRQGAEDVVDAVGQFYKQRYGGLSNIGETAYKDPVGMLADLSVLLTGGGALATKLGTAGKVGEFANIASKAERAAAISKAAQAGELGKIAEYGSKAAQLGAKIDPITGLPKLAGKGITKALGVGEEGLRASAEGDIAKVLNPTKEKSKALVKNKLAPEVVDRGIMATTFKGLQGKASEGVAVAKEALDAAWEALPEGTKAKINPVVEKLNAAMDDLTLNGTVPQHNAGQYKALNTLKSEILGLAADGGDLDARVARKYRQGLDAVIAKNEKSFGLTGKESSRLAAQKQAANILRSELAAQFPDLAKVNKEFTFWKGLEDVLEETAKRRTGQSGGLGRKIAKGAAMAAGASTHGVTGALVASQAIGWLDKLVQSPLWKTVSAQTKNKLANLIAAGDLAGAQRLVQIPARPSLQALRFGRAFQATQNEQ